MHLALGWNYCPDIEKLINASALRNGVFYARRSHLCSIMRKPAFCICENKGANQLCSNCTADQRLYFRGYTDSIITLFSTPLAIFCACIARFVSDLFGKPLCWFSFDAAHLLIFSFILSYLLKVAGNIF